jgi:SWI/SNF-related matrix-associated actin-dependent regulator 1 of chromatin subfamily A
MKLIEKDGTYRTISMFEERAIPKNAGFTWNKADHCWETNDPAKAALLAEYAEEELRGRLRQFVESAIALSKASAVPPPTTSASPNAGPAPSTEIPDFPKPDGLDYLPFQKAGIMFALDHPNVLIADDMGLGKTVQAIGIYNADPSIRNVLIACPASLTLNWKREFEKWGLRKPVVRIANSSDFPRSANIIVFNYDIAHKVRPKIDEWEWDLFIADECHMLKNGKALRTLSVLGGRKVETIKDPLTQQEKKVTLFTSIRAKRRAFLTGTPILNRPVELWTLIHTLDPQGLGKNWVSFVERYCDGHKTKYGWDGSGASHLEELQERLRSSFMVRRLKEDVLTELPGKRRVVLEIPAYGNVARIVEEEKRRANSLNDKIEQITAQAIMADAEKNEVAFRHAVRLLRSAEALAFDEMSRVRHDTAIAKIPHMIEHLDDSLETSPKIIVFAHHLDVIEALADHYGDQCVTLTGQHSPAQRQAAVDRFQQDPNCRVFIGNIIAAGVGWTLTASSHVVFCELDWRPGIVSQAEDRANRIGQKNMVLVQHLVFEGSIDAAMATKIISKQEIISTALDRETASAFERRMEHAKNQDAEEAVVAELTAPTQPGPYSTTHPTSAWQTVDNVRKELDVEGFSMTREQCQAVLYELQFMASSCDGARSLDGTGFNRMDAYMGRQLSMCAELTPRQAALGRRILAKYRRQLGNEILDQVPHKNVEDLAATA